MALHWLTKSMNSPGAFDRKAFHFQQLPKRIILTMDNMLPLFVIQFLHNDVLAKVVHYLKFKRSGVCQVPLMTGIFKITAQSVPFTYSRADKA